jgi:hypothetical protein
MTICPGSGSAAALVAAAPERTIPSRPNMATVRAPASMFPSNELRIVIMQSHFFVPSFFYLFVADRKMGGQKNGRMKAGP